MNRRVDSKRMLAAVSAVFACLAIAASPQRAQALEKLVFGNPNPAGLNIGLGPIFYATQMGFFKEENLEIEYVNFNGGAVLDPQVANKSVDIGWQGPDSVVISHDIGRDPLPAKFFYNHLRRNVWELVVPADSKIKTISDLKGATIGVNSIATTNIPTTMSILASAGLDPKKDVTFVAVGMGPPAFQALRSKQIDVLNLFDTMHTMLERSGFKLAGLEFPSKFVHLSENSLLTHVDNLKNKRTALVGYGRALAKGTIGCYANLPACVRLAWQQDPKLKPQGKSDQEAMDDALAVLKIRGLSYFDFPNNHRPESGGRFPRKCGRTRSPPYMRTASSSQTRSTSRRSTRMT